MNILFWVLAAVMLIFIMIQGRTVIPRIISFLSPESRRLYFEDDSSTSLTEKKREIILPILAKIEALGFSRLGIMLDKPPLWARGSREVVLASAAEQTFASAGLRRNNVSYFFYTPFTGGQVVITAYNAFRNASTPEFVTTVVYSEGIEEMLAIHKKQVEEFMVKGFTPYMDYSRESVIKATRAFYRSPFPRQQLRLAGTINLLIYLVFILVLALLVWRAVG
jgi:hypothetical protein